jgi:hypothetical protein
MAETHGRSRVAELQAEYEDGQLGDVRLDRRLVSLAATLAAEPEASFPAVTRNDAELEATYRFLNNDRVSPEGILRPHVRCTVARAQGSERVIVAHDTTEFNFGASARNDLGRVGQGKSHGFYAHYGLVVRGDETREPLGVVSLRIHSRDGSKGRGRGHHKLQTDPHNESRRWLASVETAEEILRPQVAPIHVMDREADSYALMADLIGGHQRFVIRMAGAKRRIDEEPETVGEALQGAAVVAEREVPLSARGHNKLPSYRKHFPERAARMATLQVSSARVTVRRPASSNYCPQKKLVLHAVRVFEPNPPEGQPAVEWRLWTTEPVDTADQVLAIVDAYRCRWPVEEFFKALKTGCALEARQLESTRALVNALAIFTPIAWRLLALRSLTHTAPDLPATRVLSRPQLTCLRAALRKLNRPELPKTPTVRDALLGVAALGGHLKNNGDPGWIVLGRGMDKLLTIELGFFLAQAEM